MSKMKPISYIFLNQSHDVVSNLTSRAKHRCHQRWNPTKARAKETAHDCKDHGSFNILCLASLAPISKSWSQSRFRIAVIRRRFPQISAHSIFHVFLYFSRFFLLGSKGFINSWDFNLFWIDLKQNLVNLFNSREFRAVRDFESSRLRVVPTAHCLGQVPE